MATASSISLRLDMPVLNRIGSAGRRHGKPKIGRGELARADLPGRHAEMLRKRSTAATENAELRKIRPCARARGRKALPLLRREFHPPPIVEARFVLLREAHSERLVQGRLGRRDMGLELDRVGAGVRRRIDEGMREPKRAVMRLRDLGDNEGLVARPNAAAGDIQTCHVPNSFLTRVFIFGQPEAVE